jgi:polyketide synthase PksJ
MNSLEILQALRSGKMSTEEAKNRIKHLSTDPVSKKPDKTGAIAIVGMSGRYPDAENLDQYWNNLETGKNSIKEIPASRWDVKEYFDPSPYQKDKIYCKWLGLMDDIEHFDPLFFSISPTEAELMDPQHRIFLQEAYKAFEDAGYNSQTLSNKKCGVYLGIMSFEYGLMLKSYNAGIGGTMGNSYSIAAARIAYHLNLKGPAIAIDTACSSSLVAIHLARQALLNYETDMALAGGVSLYLTPESYISMCSAGMLSKDGQCKTFDNTADGFVPGEGAGALVLKRLSDAIADNDSVYGVIIGSGINQDGKTNGITAPSINSQIALEREIYEKYNIDPETISYVEMHGTGTKLGDPIELEALATVFRESTVKKNYCALGSVKTNIGHTSAAAGVASVQKIVLSLKYKKIVPTLNINKPNNHFDFENSPFFINRSLKEWQVPGSEKRRAAVSSFGFSGTNAHMIIEEFPVSEKERIEPDAPVLIILSAKSKEQLKQYAETVFKHLTANKNTDLSDLAYTLQVGRDAMNHRLAFIADSVSTILNKLDIFIKDTIINEIVTGDLEQSAEGRVIFSEKDWEMLFNTLVQQQELRKIAEFWVKGIHVDWNRLYKNKPHRISLPTYPFAKERYWLPLPEDVSSISEVFNHSSKKVSSVFLRKQWEAESIIPQGRFGHQPIILTTPETQNLAREVATHFTHCKIVNDAELHSVNLSEKEYGNYNAWIDLTGCGDKKQHTLEWIEPLQRLIEYGRRDQLKILGITKGLESFKNTSINLTGADRAGLYRMLQSEYSYLSSAHVDLEVQLNDVEVAKYIAAEFRSGSEGIEICIRNSIRYRAVLREQDLASVNRKELIFPSDQVLWITGGTRGIGLLCAQHFADNFGVRKMVLTGRESIPPREQWNSVLTSATAMAKKIKAIQSLETLGVEVKIISVSLTDAAALQKELKIVHETMGSVGGFIHSAGSVNNENPAFIRKSLAEIEQVRQTKVEAIDTLYHCFKNDPLKFFLMFSSVAATIPSLGAGQSDYAMANAYMDYFAESKNEIFPVTSIQWASWKETGFGEVKSRAYEQSGLISQSNTEGLLLLDTILKNNDNPVILPAIVNKNNWSPDQLLIRQTPEEMNTTTSTTPITAPQEWAISGEQIENVQSWLTALLSKELKINKNKLDPDTQFQLYGIDSIILAQLVVKIDKALDGVKLDPSALIEHCTIKNLSHYLLHTYPQAAAKLSTNIAVNKGLKNLTVVDSKTGSEEVRKSTTTQRDKIAIIGMACHFPAAADIREYWDNLANGRDCMVEIPGSRWDWKKHYDPAENATGKSICKYGGFISGIENFDPAYFKISESLAPFIDPLQRQWLEVSTEALVDAGYTIKELSGKNVGVFAGARTSNFGIKYPQQVKDRIVGIGQNFITAHLAHIYNFKGPNMVVDTACSSSLTAIHLAVNSINNGESDIAIAGGVDILLDEGLFIGLSDAKILSPQGRCKTFDANANGIGLGEGCGVLILKSLQKAIRDNDKIYAVIDGSAINNDGNTMGITTPNPYAQKDLINAAIANANIHPETITYVETHGTGTLIGDPIELKGLTNVFDEHTSKKQFCGVGSVKSNIGHLLSAAGAASMIKVLLSIIHQQLPPTLHCTHPNPRFNFNDSPLYLVNELKKWETENSILRAGVSAFGLGGNNAHIILSNEGIPRSHMASAEPKGEPVKFNRKKYWPLELRVKKDQKPGFSEAIENAEHLIQEDDFMKLFEIQEL